MRQTAFLVSVLLSGTVLSGTALALDPQLLSLAMPDAKILGGVNATSAKASPFGQFVISKVGLGGVGRQQFIAATGFNPLEDVTEVLAATAADPAHPGGLLLVRGNFSVNMILAAVNGRPNAQVQTYAGNPLIVTTNPQQKVAHAVAFIGGTIAVAGDLTSVEAALDRVNNPSSIDPALAAKAAQLSASEDEWLASSTSLASLLPPTAPQNPPAGTNGGPGALRSQVLPLLKNVLSFNGGVKFGDNVQFTGEAVSTDANNAGALEAVLKLGLVLVSSNASNTANGPGRPRLAEAIQMLQGLQVTTNGAAVDVSLSIPETQIEALLNTPAAGRARLAGPRHGAGVPDRGN